MQKGCMLKLVTAVILLISAPFMDAAPLEVLGLYWKSLRDNQKPPEAWTSGPKIHDTTTSFDKLLGTGPMTTDSDGHKKTVPVGVSDILDKTTSSPVYLEKFLVATNSLGRTLKTVKTNSRGRQKILSASNSFGSQFMTDFVRDGPEITVDATKEGSSIYKLSKLIPVTNNFKKALKTVLPTRSAKIFSSDISTLNRHQTIMRMLSALEKLHKSLNSHITLIPRGHSNSRSGKANKMTVPEGNMKSTTASSMVSSGTSPRLSTDQVDTKHLTGKTLRKTLPSTPKKTNKRVCFWKYCSQN